MAETPMKKQALLIGINEYQLMSKLKYARQDAEAVADSLKQNYCFSDNEVMLLTDDRPGLFKPTSRYIIQDHLEKLAKQNLDLFIFGFWGHGLFRNGKRYLCPLDVMANRAEYQGLPFDELQELLSKIYAKNTCMILDCCQTIHDRGEAETLTVSEQTIMENAARDIVLRRKEQMPDFQSNVAILNSCKEGQSAYEWDERKHGLFTAHLLDAMKKRSNSVMQIANYISSNMEKTALELGKDQTPFYKLEGDIVLPVETKSMPPESFDFTVPKRHISKNPLDSILEQEELEKQKRIEHLQSLAAAYYTNGDYEKAIPILKEILVLDLNSIAAQKLLARCQLRVEERKDLSVPGAKAGERKTYTVNGVEFAFRWCPAGTFMMGSPTSEEGRYDDEKQHRVTLTKGFWMMEMEVTQKQWKAVMENNPSNFKGDDLPVECVSWNDCQEFCRKCSALGLPVLLPTEAQWEYACRAGSTDAYAGNLDDMAWYYKNSGSKTHPVGTKNPNAWGLYDMHGNVWEWCQDWKGDYPKGSVTDPTGPANGSLRVSRSGTLTGNHR